MALFVSILIEKIQRKDSLSMVVSGGGSIWPIGIMGR